MSSENVEFCQHRSDIEELLLFLGRKTKYLRARKCTEFNLPGITRTTLAPLLFALTSALLLFRVFTFQSHPIILFLTVFKTYVYVIEIVVIVVNVVVDIDHQGNLNQCLMTPKHHKVDPSLTTAATKLMKLKAFVPPVGQRRV